MSLILSLLMFMHALSLPPIQKKIGILSAHYPFVHETSLIEIDKKLSKYRIIIEASSTKVNQCFYYIDGGYLQRGGCRKVKTPIENLYEQTLENLKDKKTLETVFKETKDLLSELAKEISNSNEHGTVAVNILATAGMRKLNIEDQNNIWAMFLKRWKGHSKEFNKELPEGSDIQLYSIQDTSGIEEGVYGCMVANVAMGNLDLSLNLQNDGAPVKIAQVKIAQEKMVGIVEIGGASVQITVPKKDGKNTKFNNFNNFHSCSIPFGKEYFFQSAMKSMPEACKFVNGQANFKECYDQVSGAIRTKVDETKVRDEFGREGNYYLLGGVFTFAWNNLGFDKIKNSRNSPNDAYSQKKPSLVSLRTLLKWTKKICLSGKVWPTEPVANPMALFDPIACYNAVYAWSLLKEFPLSSSFYLGSPLSENNPYLKNNDFVDWPSAAYMYLNSNPPFDRPSTEVSVTEIQDDQYQKNSKT